MPAISNTTARNLTVLVGSTLTILAATVISPSLPEMSAHFQDVPNAEFLVRLSLTLPALFVAVSAPFAGLLLDRVGRKPVLIAALILYGAAGASGFVVESLAGILVGRAVLGLAIAGVMSSFTTLIVDYFSGPRLNQYMGYQGAFIGLGGLVYLSLAGVLADVGWRDPFLIYLFAFVVLLGVLLVVEEPKVSPDAADDSNRAHDPALFVRTVALIYVLAIAAMIILFVFLVQLPFYLSAVAGASNTQVGLALALQAPTSVMTALLFRRIRERLSFQGITALIFLALGINHVIVALTVDYGLILIAMVIGGLGLGLLAPNFSVWLASVIPHHVRGRAVGGLTAAIFVGQFISPIAAQPVVQLVGMAGTFGVAAGASLLVAVIFAAVAVSQALAAPPVGS